MEKDYKRALECGTRDALLADALVKRANEDKCKCNIIIVASHGAFIVWPFVIIRARV